MSDIDSLRDEMDKVTLDMIKLLKTRTDVSRKIGKIKKDVGKGISDEHREKDLHQKVLSLCNEIKLDESIASNFLNFLFNESIKLQSIGRQTHISIFLKAKSLEEQGKKIIHMEVGQPDFMPPPSTKEALAEVYDKGFVKYGPAKGLPQFRQALAQYASKKFNATVHQKNILVSPGARFSVFLAITSLLNPGDEIILIEPAWPAYKDCALNAGIKVRTIKTTLEKNWEPSVHEIKDKVNPNTKMIVLNYPNNPTGKILSSDTQDQIISIAKDNDLYVLSDEIYSEYSSDKWRSILEYDYQKSIVTQSFSKSHAMTGFRIGYAIAQEQIIDKMSNLQALCMTNVSEPIQYVAMRSLGSEISENPKLIKTS